MRRFRRSIVFLLAAALAAFVAVSAQAVKPPPSPPAQLVFDPTEGAFGSVPVGGSSAAQVFTLAYVGKTSSTALRVQLQTGHPTEFVITADTCSGKSLTPKHSCTVSVEFAPENPGVDESTTLVASAKDLSASVGLSGYSASVNQAPSADGQSGLATPAGVALPITLSGSDPDGDELTFAIVSGPEHGSMTPVGVATSCVTGLGGGPSSCTMDTMYTPAGGYSGPDSFTFKVNDGTADSAAATVSIDVISINQGPSAEGQSVTVPMNQGLAITLAGSDPDGDPLTFSVADGPLHGTVTLIGSPSCVFGTGRVPSSCTQLVGYTPSRYYTGPDSFTFEVSDGSPDTARATVSIDVAIS